MTVRPLTASYLPVDGAAAQLFPYRTFLPSEKKIRQVFNLQIPVWRKSSILIDRTESLFITGLTSE